MDGQRETKEEKAVDLQYQVEDYFTDDTLLNDFKSIFRDPSQESDKDIAALEAVFGNNMLAAFFTASMLPVFARRTAYNAGYMSLFGVAIGNAMLADKSGRPIEQARAKLKERIEGSEWGKNLNDMAQALAKDYLANFIQDEAGRETISQIMNQCTVLMWSSFEILASDIFVTLLNRKPGLAAVLFNGENTKKYYREKEIAASLPDYNYNLSQHMGEALIQQRRLDDLMAIKNIYGVLLEKSDGLRDILNESQLWKLYKTRNLIVHRAGVVDALFRKDTGDNTPVGTRLRVTPAELKVFMALVGRAGAELVQAANAILKRP